MTRASDQSAFEGRVVASEDRCWEYGDLCGGDDLVEVLRHLSKETTMSVQNLGTMKCNTSPLRPGFSLAKVSGGRCAWGAPSLDQDRRATSLIFPYAGRRKRKRLTSLDASL